MPWNITKQGSNTNHWRVLGIIKLKARRHVEDNVALGYAGNDWNHQESKSVEIGVIFLDIQILTYWPERYYVFGSYDFGGKRPHSTTNLVFIFVLKKVMQFGAFAVLNLIQGSVHPIASLLVRHAFRSSICCFFIARRRVKLGPSTKKNTLPETNVAPENRPPQ